MKVDEYRLTNYTQVHDGAACYLEIECEVDIYHSPSILPNAFKAIVRKMINHYSERNGCGNAQKGKVKFVEGSPGNFTLTLFWYEIYDKFPVISDFIVQIVVETLVDEINETLYSFIAAEAPSAYLFDNNDDSVCIDEFSNIKVKNNHILGFTNGRKTPKKLQDILCDHFGYHRQDEMIICTGIDDTHIYYDITWLTHFQNIENILEYIERDFSDSREGSKVLSIVAAEQWDLSDLSDEQFYQSVIDYIDAGYELGFDLGAWEVEVAAICDKYNCYNSQIKQLIDTSIQRGIILNSAMPDPPF